MKTSYKSMYWVRLGLLAITVLSSSCRHRDKGEKFNVVEYETGTSMDLYENVCVIDMTQTISHLENLSTDTDYSWFVESIDSLVKDVLDHDMSAKIRYFLSIKIVAVMDQFAKDKTQLFQLYRDVDYEELDRLLLDVIEETAEEYVIVERCVSDDARALSNNHTILINKYIEGGYKELPEFTYTRMHDTSQVSSEIKLLDRICKRLAQAHGIRQNVSIKVNEIKGKVPARTM